MKQRWVCRGPVWGLCYRHAAFACHQGPAGPGCIIWCQNLGLQIFLRRCVRRAAAIVLISNSFAKECFPGAPGPVNLFWPSRDLTRGVETMTSIQANGELEECLPQAKVDRIL
jgi:hypothetical protein